MNIVIILGIKKIPSQNGFYFVDDRLDLWPVLRTFLFSFIDKAAKYLLREQSRKKCDLALLNYIQTATDKPMPVPAYLLQDLHLVSVGLQHDELYKEIVQFQDSWKNLPTTEREAVVHSRIGQGEFRNRLIHYWKGCAVTGCKRLEILRASHIKPWRDSDNRERLDVHNGLLLAPNLDAAFDKGFISFDDDGSILISSKLDERDRLALGIHPEMRIRVDPRHRPYWLIIGRKFSKSKTRKLETGYPMGQPVFQSVPGVTRPMCHPPNPLFFHHPCHTGERFSKKAHMPSWASAAVAFRDMTSFV